MTAALFDHVVSSAPFPFAGAEFSEARDRARLTRQIDCIQAHTSDGRWRTVQKLTAELRRAYPGVGFPENSVAAQLRNLKKIGYRLERQHVANGLFEYRILPPVNPGVGAALRGAVQA